MYYNGVPTIEVWTTVVVQQSCTLLQLLPMGGGQSCLVTQCA